MIKETFPELTGFVAPLTMVGEGYHSVAVGNVPFTMLDAPRRATLDYWDLVSKAVNDKYYTQLFSIFLDTHGNTVVDEWHSEL